MAYNHTQNLNSLQERLNRGKSQLLDLLDEWHVKNTSERSRILFDYEKVFGEFESKIKLHYKEAKNLEGKLNALKEKLRVKKSSKDSSYSKSINGSFKEKDSTTFNESEFNSVYRTIVKKLHPDLNDSTLDFDKYWNNIQFAYKSKDYLRLRMYSETLFNDSFTEANEFASEETQTELLSKKIEEIENYIKEEKSNLLRLQYTEPFCYEDRLKDHRWVMRHRHLLRNKLKQAKNKVEFNKKLLENMNVRYRILVGDENVSKPA